MFCYIAYDSIPNEYTKLEESFGGFINKSLVKFEYEKSPLHTIVYGGTGIDKTFFIRPYLKLYLDQDRETWSETHQNQNQDNKNIIIVCKNKRDWINRETGKPYSNFNMCDINMITS